MDARPQASVRSGACTPDDTRPDHADEAKPASRRRALIDARRARWFSRANSSGAISILAMSP